MSTRCKYCDAPIEWIDYMYPISGEVKKIPLDLRATTYIFDDATRKSIRSSAKVVHMAVCPSPNVKVSLTKEEDDPRHGRWWEDENR